MATLHKHEGAGLTTMAAPFPAAVALCWALSESPCQKSRALGWDVSHDHHENKAANQMAPEAVTQREFLFFLCFKHCHSLFPGVNFPPSGAKQCSKSPAVLKRLKGFIYQKHFFVVIILGRRTFSLRERNVIVT